MTMWTSALDRAFCQGAAGACYSGQTWVQSSGPPLRSLSLDYQSERSLCCKVVTSFSDSWPEALPRPSTVVPASDKFPADNNKTHNVSSSKQNTLHFTMCFPMWWLIYCPFYPYQVSLLCFILDKTWRTREAVLPCKSHVLDMVRTQAPVIHVQCFPHSSPSKESWDMECGQPDETKKCVIWRTSAWWDKE